jgi:hypothetical protein
MDIRANLAIIPDPRINRCKKHLLTDILLLCIIAYEGVSTIKSLKNVFSTGHRGTFGNRFSHRHRREDGQGKRYGY